MARYPVGLHNRVIDRQFIDFHDLPEPTVVVKSHVLAITLGVVIPVVVLVGYAYSLSSGALA